MRIPEVATSLGMTDRKLRAVLRELQWPKDGHQYSFSQDDLTRLRELVHGEQEGEDDSPGLPVEALTDRRRRREFKELREAREARLMSLVRERLQ